MSNVTLVRWTGATHVMREDGRTLCGRDIPRAFEVVTKGQTRWGCGRCLDAWRKRLRKHEGAP